MAKRSGHGTFDSDPEVRLLKDGRLIQLTKDFGYIDAKGERWDVPAGAELDGASIPRTLWSVLGGPLEGKYRTASIIHDWHCDIRTRQWQEVHRVFFDGMLAAGVGQIKAVLMYGGVYWGGPRWSTTVSNNTRLLRDLNRSGQSGRVFYLETLEPISTTIEVESRSYHYAFDDADLATLKERIGKRRLAPDTIDRLVDELLTDRRPVELEPPRRFTLS